MKPWVVVEHAGFTDEKIACECSTYEDALTAKDERYSSFEQDELDVDIMKRLPDGELTTEY